MSDGKNIFELWKENGEKLPFKAIINSWSEEKGHYAIIEKVEVKTWPYGDAYGQYFFHGKAGERGKIRNAGTYRWRMKL
jgi:hypothetical protein